MKPGIRAALAVAPSVLLAACAGAPTEQETPPAPLPRVHAPAAPVPAETLPKPPVVASPPAAPALVAPIAGSVRAMEYFSRMRQRTLRELKSEYEQVRRAFAGSRSDFDRMRLALLLSLPNTPFSDEGQALDLLEPLVRDDGSEYQGLAQLVSMLLAEQRRRGVQATALQQKLDRIKALEKEMQQRAATPEIRPR